MRRGRILRSQTVENQRVHLSRKTKALRDRWLLRSSSNIRNLLFNRSRTGLLRRLRGSRRSPRRTTKTSTRLSRVNSKGVLNFRMPSLFLPCAAGFLFNDVWRGVFRQFFFVLVGPFHLKFVDQNRRRHDAI